MLASFLDHITQQYVKNVTLVKIISELIVSAVIIIVAIFAYYAVKCIINYWLKRKLKRAESEFLRDLSSRIQGNLFGHLASALIFRLGSNFVIRHGDIYSSYLANVISTLSTLYLFIVVVVIITSLVKAINPYYETKFDQATRYPIKPYLNVINFVIWIFSVIFIIAFFSNSSLTSVVAGLGAASAIFLLIFRDTLLGIVSSIQAATSNIAQVGDRIAIEKYNLDGTVLNISISGVKVRSQDNIVATIPTYMLTSEVVKNYKSLKKYGNRRIKRAILIDINSIRPLEQEELSKFDNLHLIHQYTTEYPKDKIITNLELFRLYVENYLQNCPDISEDEDLAVYSLPPTEKGLPVEIYAYTRLVNFTGYEHLQSKITEHCLIKLREFGLSVFQNRG